ncbi:unnamed protein product [Cochlearia groenlandica]
MENNLMLKSREILATQSYEGIESLLQKLSLPNKQSLDFKSAVSLFDFCVERFANCLALKLLKFYQSPSSSSSSSRNSGDLRYTSLYLLSETVSLYRIRGFRLSINVLNEIKPILISCLNMDEIDYVIEPIGRIVSYVAYNVAILDDDNRGWEELGDCIISLDSVMAFRVFLDLPCFYGKFIFKFMEKNFEEAVKILNCHEEDRVEFWSFGLKVIVKLGIMLLDDSMKRLDLISNLLCLLVNSASELVLKKGMEQFLLKGLVNLEMFLAQDKKLYDYSKDQCLFVLTFMYKIKDLGTQTKEAAAKICLLVKSTNNNPLVANEKKQDHGLGSDRDKPLVADKKKQDHGLGSDREWLDRLNGLSPLEILRIFASSSIEDKYREIAIRRLNLLLSDHTSKKAEIDIPVIIDLQPLLISCLKEARNSDSMFKVLGEVVYHVSYEMMNIQCEVWYGLRDYIVSQSKTEFHKAVYIFQCLTMWLEDDEFVIPVMESLLPEIKKRLNPPSDSLVDNNCWVSAFVGAFCAVIHLVEITSYAEAAKEVEDKMIDSVRELVGRGMEVGFVRRGLRDVESIVKRQNEWFGNSEYVFLKRFVKRLYEIKEMKMESRIVLWRINVLVERGVAEMCRDFDEET